MKLTDYGKWVYITGRHYGWSSIHAYKSRRQPWKATMGGLCFYKNGILYKEIQPKNLYFNWFWYNRIIGKVKISLASANKTISYRVSKGKTGIFSLPIVSKKITKDGARYYQYKEKEITRQQYKSIRNELFKNHV